MNKGCFVFLSIVDREQLNLMFIEKEKKFLKTKLSHVYHLARICRMLDTARASGLVCPDKKQPVMGYQELWPELKEYVFACLETPSNFMVHTELGPFEVQVHLILEKHVSHLRTRNGRGKPRFLNFLGYHCCPGHCLHELDI